MATSNGYQDKIKEKNYAGKKLRSLPQDLIKNGHDVIALHLEKNKLKDFSSLVQLSNLTELNLSRNELTDFPVEIGKLHHLVRLYINQNSIRNISDNVLSSLQKLQFLKMSTNQLVELPKDINKCKRLAYLNVSINKLKSLQPLEGLQLEELYVDKNNLTELPSFIVEPKTLKKLKMSGNPLRVPPAEVCEGGLKQIRNFFALLKDHSPITVSTIKTMFLGSTMAGKSTLSRSLKNERPIAVAEDDRTVGIEISKVEQDGICFRFWDFAGQEEYYFTHHVFITPQALVILVIDLSSYDVTDPKSFKEKVSFWISNIQLKVPCAVVQLVGTHVDTCASEQDVKRKIQDIEQKVKKMQEERYESLDVQRMNLEELNNPSMYNEQINQIKRLQEDKLEIPKLIAIDSTKSEDISRLQTHIKDITSKEDKFPFMKQTLPKCYEDTETLIQSRLNREDIPQHGLVSLDELLNLLHDDTKLNHDDLKSILQYLHRIGAIMWYDDIQDLKNMVFVKPSFLISLFKAIVRHDVVKELESISRRTLMLENALVKHRETWIDDFSSSATLSNVAVRILVRQELEKLCTDDLDLIQEIVGTKKKTGSLLTLMQHFEVCLAMNKRSVLNPTAPEFSPNKKWKLANPTVYEADGVCLFPSFLKDNAEVVRMWGVNHQEDINIQVYFLPEIPYVFFHRLAIKICSVYHSCWIGKDQFLISYQSQRVLLEKHTEQENEFIEMRGKHSDVEPSGDNGKVWDMIRVVLIELNKLTQQWGGLLQLVHSPCRHDGCNKYFEWQDWQDWLISSNHNIKPEGKVTCRGGHVRKAELLFPDRTLVPGEEAPPSQPTSCDQA